MTDLLAVGTRKGLFLARSDDGRRTWTVDGPHLLAQEVAAVSIDTRSGTPRLLAAILYGHWGPTVMRSDDLGATWQETESGAIRFPEDADAALGRVWQLRPDTADRPGLVWAGCEPHSLWRSTDGGENFSLVRGLWDHPHRPTWQPGAGGGAVHTVLPDPASDRVTVAMSTGGVYVSEDGGDSWTPRNKGITVPFMPDELPASSVRKTPPWFCAYIRSTSPASTATLCTHWPYSGSESGMKVAVMPLLRGSHFSPPSSLT